jgi:hypothetical protein
MVTVFNVGPPTARRSVGGTTSVLITSSASVLVTAQDELVTTTRNMAPLSGNCANSTVQLELVAPRMDASSRYHWKNIGVAPVTPTSKVIAQFCKTSIDCGWRVIASGHSWAGALHSTVKAARVMHTLRQAAALAFLPGFECEPGRMRDFVSVPLHDR